MTGKRWNICLHKIGGEKNSPCQANNRSLESGGSLRAIVKLQLTIKVRNKLMSFCGQLSCSSMLHENVTKVVVTSVENYAGHQRSAKGQHCRRSWWHIVFVYRRDDLHVDSRSYQNADGGRFFFNLGNISQELANNYVPASVGEPATQTLVKF